MAILKLENGEILSKKFPLRNTLLVVGHILDFEEAPNYKVEKTPNWYKNIQSRKFEVVRVEMQCGWANGGLMTGFQLNIEYIVKEILNNQNQ
jgi:hypothetical protein